MDAGIGMLILAVLAGLFAVAKLRRRPERRRAKRRSSNLHDAGRSTRGGSRSATDTPSPNGSASPGAWAAYYKKRSWLVTRSEKQFEEQVRASLDELGLQDWRVAVQVAASALVERRPGAKLDTPLGAGLRGRRRAMVDPRGDRTQRCQPCSRQASRPGLKARRRPQESWHTPPLRGEPKHIEAGTLAGRACTGTRAKAVATIE